METLSISQNDELIMKLLHYFVTEQNYNPIILKGAQNEIWLENLEGDYKIVRLVSNYIHNNDQMEMDIYRTEQIMKRIKKKTMSFSMNALSIFVNLGDNVELEDNIGNIDCVDIKKIEDLNKYEFVLDEFPTIMNKIDFKEEGMDLFIKLTTEIGAKNDSDAKKAEDIFTKKDPIITKILLLINIVVFLLQFVYGQNSLLSFGALYGPAVKSGEIYRLFTAAFIHIDILHLLFNCYALYVIGPQIENFFGKWKYLGIYLFSAVCGNMLSIMFNPSTVSIGASGAIFGIMGSLVYFGYYYRTYLDGIMKSQIIPMVLLNLILGFLVPGIDGFAHLGGLIGGVIISSAVGIKYKSKLSDIINGIIIALIFMGFLGYMVFIH
ncbi:MAG TPA: rhomboid family intramembrane serine protease [Bacilli bacterium]|nr:rhomboid family intramembrane serine protease [Bacilli bacterium]